jgi:hypothetical protein
MNLESYSISDKQSSLTKCTAVWAHSGNTMAPLIYLRRPKWIEDDRVWSEIVKSISVTLPVGFEIK